MEQRLQDATTQGARVIVVRAGDFFGPRAGNNWFSQALVKPNQPLKKVSRPGRVGIGHQWAFLPDVARTMVTLINQRDTLPSFARFHMEGHWDADGTQMTDAIFRVARRHGLHPKVSAFPWWQTKLLAPLIPTLREMQEMRYLWERPLRLNGNLLKATIGHEPHTPLDEAVELTLKGLGCIESD